MLWNEISSKFGGVDWMSLLDFYNREEFMAYGPSLLNLIGMFDRINIYI